ncbi:MAG: hypothetical protein HY209_05960 [Candidatus Omnitrophica bacterium]|nr:hypothetical protein [Candidatus Omnitrophota bacterium]
MMYLFALAVAVALGYCTLRLIVAGRLSFYLSLFLGAALGLGIIGQIIFYLQLLGNNFNHFLPPLVSLFLLVVLFWLNKSLKIQSHKNSNGLSLLVLILLSVPLWLEANYYPLGGWDAWSCWNLKAKFIYLAEDHWKDIFTPILWRSNIHYPLGLPTINVWFWHWSGVSQSVPMLNAVVLALLTAGVLLLGLQELKVSQWISIVVTLSVFTLAFGNTLSISQYSDILFSLYLLAALVCYLLSRDLKDNRLLILTAVFTGLLSFTKNEGLAASVILTLLVLSQQLHRPWAFISALIAVALPTIIFILWMVPPNETFINGLATISKPSTFLRLQYVLVYPWFEFISLKWNGLWILAVVGLMLAGGQAMKKPLNIIGLFVALYLAVLMAYYQINTFFEIGWWMSMTFNRIVFALMPTVFLWLALSLFRKDA